MDIFVTLLQLNYLQKDKGYHGRGIKRDVYTLMTKELNKIVSQLKLQYSQQHRTYPVETPVSWTNIMASNRDFSNGSRSVCYLDEMQIGQVSAQKMGLGIHTHLSIQTQSTVSFFLLLQSVFFCLMYAACFSSWSSLLTSVAKL